MLAEMNVCVIEIIVTSLIKLLMITHPEEKQKKKRNTNCYVCVNKGAKYIGKNDKRLNRKILK